jgi:hypothetical protein
VSRRHVAVGISIGGRVGFAALVLCAATHAIVHAASLRATSNPALLVEACLAATLAFLRAFRPTTRWRRQLHAALGLLTLASGVVLAATSDQTVHANLEGGLLVVLLGYSLAAAAGAIREGVASSIQAIQFAVGVFVLDQLAAFGLGDILLLRWPELLERAWPLAVAGELVQESCLILVVGMSMAASPALLDTRALRLPGREPRAWKAIVQAALQSEAGVLAFVVVAWLILETLRADVGQIDRERRFSAAGRLASRRSRSASAVSSAPGHHRGARVPRNYVENDARVRLTTARGPCFQRTVWPWASRQRHDSGERIVCVPLHICWRLHAWAGVPPDWQPLRGNPGAHHREHGCLTQPGGPA